MSNFDFDARTRDYSRANAYWLGRAAQIAYGSFDAARQETEKWGFTELQSFESMDTGTQAFAAGNGAMLLLSFRGTEKDPKDWLTDFDAAFVNGPRGMVHEGFMIALNSIWRDIWQYLATQRRGRALWVTGHSLGAALATLAVAKLRFERDEPVNGLYTFGQPRTGNRDFASDFDADFGGQTFRYVNNNDIVARVPPRSSGYSHVGSFRYFDKNGNQDDQMDWWDKVVDRMKGNIKEILNSKPGLDGIKDHAIINYVRCLELAKKS